MKIGYGGLIRDSSGKFLFDFHGVLNVVEILAITILLLFVFSLLADVTQKKY